MVKRGRRRWEYGQGRLKDERCRRRGGERGGGSEEEEEEDVDNYLNGDVNGGHQ